MSKNLNHRPLSASNRKGTFSHDPSPLHSSKVKKDNQAYFQPPELDSRLRISSRQNVRKNEGKVLGTNLFINNLNVQLNHPSQPTHKKMSAPLTVAITNRKNSKQYSGLSQKEEAALAEYRNDKNSYKDGRPPSGIRENVTQSILGNSLYEIRKNPVAIIPKHHTEGLIDLSRSNYIPKFKGSDPNNKFMLKSPPKVVSQNDPYTKFKKPNGRNQKSFDVNAGPIGKYTPYLNSTTKPPSTANNSPRNRDSENRVTKTENLSHLSHGIAPKSTKAPLERNMITSKVINKSPIMASKHRKTPSLDSSKRQELMQQKTTTPPILDRIRKSADQGDYWQGTMQNQHFENFAKSTFRFAIRTRAGVAPNGTRKINQDSFIFHTNYGKKSDRYLLGVCDGHGMNGHFVSGFVKESLPIYLLADPNFESNIGIALTNAFELCHQKLLVADFDCKFSGTTSIVLLIEGNKIISANAGDSRAVMGSYNKGWTCKPLSQDHKPDSPMEAQRILKNGGRIEPFKDFDGSFVGPARVWLANQDIPGLAMARSIGDIVASTVGVSCLPEIKEFSINSDDKFLIVASDGVWEFIESIDVVRMIVPFYEQNNIEGACDYLLGVALKRWQEEEEVVVDDITLIIIFF